jgi:hypothetical protein
VDIDLENLSRSHLQRPLEWIPLGTQNPNPPHDGGFTGVDHDHLTAESFETAGGNPWTHPHLRQHA